MDSRISIWSGRPLRAHESLLTEALGLGDNERGRAARMLGEAALAASMAGRTELAIATASKAQRLAQTADSVSRAMVAIDRAILSMQSNRALEHERAIADAIGDLGPLESAEICESLGHCAAMLLWDEQYDASEQILVRVVEAARERRWPMLALWLDTLGGLEFRMDRWDAADAHSAEAIRLARQNSGDSFVLASALTTLARVAAARGREAECREYLAEATELSSPGGLAAAYSATATGLLELGLDRPARAIAALKGLDVDTGETYSPMVTRSGPDLIEAYLRSGRAREAGAALSRFESATAADRGTWARAAAARCRGLLAPSQAFDQEFRDALDLHARTSTPFETARTRLCYGERLRRARRLTEARHQLTEALAIFERLGATTWAERARRELAPRRRPRSAESDPSLPLTSHELQVTALLRRGATNREIAAALFVTDKTVEYHLGNVFRKLDVRSRTELVLLLERSAVG
jgi:ATP/maltotriose-dependent transcriptional regulator MalT